MRIQGEKPVRMIEDYNESVAFQPVRIDHRSSHDRMDGAAFHGADLYPLPLDIRIEGRMLLPAEVGQHAAFSRPGKAALHSFRQRSGRRPGRRRSPALFEFAKKTVDSRGRSFEFLQRPFGRFLLVGELGQLKLFLFFHRLELVEMFFGAAFIRNHSQPCRFPLPLRFLHVRQVGSKGLDESVVACRHGR